MKRRLAILCACAILMSSISLCDFNVVNEEDNVINKNITISMDDNLSLVGSVSDSYLEEFSTKIIDNTDNKSSRKIRINSIAPSVYSNKQYMTEVKNQGSYGACWVFSSIAAIESNLVKKGIDSKNVDLSEAGLLYFVYNRPANETKDSITVLNEKGYLNTGGNAEFVINALSSGICLTDESVLPYNELKSETVYADKYGYYSDYILREAGIIPANDSESIKKAIMEYGSVTASLYLDTNESNYNKNNASYYQDQTKTTNHAVTIVGWDDNYSKDNFVKKPSNDGAWLIKNSWGKSWGNEGCFWVSYEDTSLNNANDNAIFFNLEKKDSKFLNIYEHDGTYSTGTIGDMRYEANVFTSKENESLTDVVFYTNVNNVSYEIEIYKDVKDVPNDGESVHIQAGSVKYAGCHTIKLDKEVNIKANTKYSVVIKLSDEDGNVIKIPLDMSSEHSGSFSFKTVASEGESFCKGDDGAWYDVGVNHSANCRIKVYTKESFEDEQEEYNEPVQEEIKEEIKEPVQEDIKEPVEEEDKVEDIKDSVISESEEKECKCSNVEILIGKKATCIADGLTEGKKCVDCNKIIVAQQIIPAKGHNEVIMPSKTATCIEEGLTEGKKCTTCGMVLIKQYKIVSEEHCLVKMEEKEATYTENGIKAHFNCTECGKKYIDSLGQVEVSNDDLMINVLKLGVTSSIQTSSRKSNAITFKWNAVKGATGYRLYVAKNGKWVQLVQATKATSYTAKNLVAGTNYRYAVKAYRIENGKVIWANAHKWADFKTLPGKISKATVTRGYSSLVISWNKVSSATGYRFYIQKNGKWVALKNATSANLLKVVGLKKGTNYKFAVKAYTVENGKTIWSDVYGVVSTSTKR